MKRRATLWMVVILGIAGFFVALYQTYEHYFLASAVCDLSATFSCSTVTGSAYGEFPPNSGIATALLGALWWGVVIFLSYGMLADKPIVPNQSFALFGVEVFGVLFMIYLLVVELYILPQQTGQLAICPFCTVQHVLILILLPLTYILLDNSVSTYLEAIL